MAIKLNAMRTDPVIGFDLRQAEPPMLPGGLAFSMTDRFALLLPSHTHTHIISVDPSVSRRPDCMANLSLSDDQINPLGFAMSLQCLYPLVRGHKDYYLLAVTLPREISIILTNRFGPGYFDSHLDQRQSLLDDSWAPAGFDVIDIDGLVSAIAGCSYSGSLKEFYRNTFAQHINQFGLFEDERIASKFAVVRGLEIKAHAPFVAAGVFYQVVGADLDPVELSA